MNRIIKLISIGIIVVLITILGINIVYAALYKSKGDVIPLATIEYNAKDNAAAFPESYRDAINELKKAHPNWTFMAVYTNLDWKDSIIHESFDVNMGISLVPMNYAAEWKKDGKNYFQDGSWVTASKEAVAYAMDPRNYLTEAGIFQFESLSAIEGVHTVEAVEKVLKGTDLETKYVKNESGKQVIDYPTYISTSNVAVKMTKTYAQVIYEAGFESGVSPIHIATRIIQETGGKFANGSICGINPGYVGYYNFFNIGATPGADGNSAVTNGLITAKNNGWDSPEKSIKAGALTLYNSYIKYGQDTIYFQKFDVSNSKGNATMLYASQYMTNILAPVSEAKLTYDAYSSLGIVDAGFVFYIPVYKNRTKENAPRPGQTIDENNIENDNEQKPAAPVSVKSISVSKSTYRVAKGSSVNIPVIVLPENAANKKYTVAVENKDIVKAEQNKITALKEGKTKVTFKTEDGAHTVSITVTVVEKEDFKLSSSLKVTEDNQIVDIHSETSASDILSNIEVTDSIKVEIRSRNGGEVLTGSKKVGTGTTVTLSTSDGEVIQSYVIIVKGDVNGDGAVSASDYVIIKNSIMGSVNLDKSQRLGADANADGEVSALDYVLIKNHIMGISKLY